jgi:NADH:ubiquinone oxidoreductase subunit
MSLLAQLFTWWNGETIATRFYTWRKGKRVGEDQQGNVYYTSPDGARRWVIYNGESEASRVAPEWHGWLHHTWQEPPTTRPIARKAWEKPHQPNLTGTALAYRPPGSILGPRRQTQARDYEAWSPE